MAKVTYIEHGTGKEHHVELSNGMSIMEGALKYAIPGIEGDCGGACACATCHIYVDDAWTGRLPEKSEMENSLLEFAPHLEAGSRLACQIPFTAELDGLKVTIAPED